MHHALIPPALNDGRRKTARQCLKQLACAFAVFCTFLGWQGNSQALASDGRVMVAVQTYEEFEAKRQENEKRFKEESAQRDKEFEERRQKMHDEFNERADKRFHQFLTFGAFAVVVVVVGLCVIAFIVTRALKK